MLSIVSRWTDRERYEIIKDGGQLPRWQGIVAYDAPTRSMLIAPIPFNWVLAWGWHFWGRLKQGWRKQDLLWTYELGYQDGKSQTSRLIIIQGLESMIKEWQDDHRSD